MATDELDPLLPGRTFGGRYQVKERLGRGGVGEVYRAFDRERGLEVALKVLRSELAPRREHRQRFLREASVVGRLRHPNIVGVLDDGEQDGRAFIAMELIQGVSLEQHLLRVHVLSPVEVHALALGVARALQAAHGAGVVHRDVKPGNILLRAERSGPGAVAVCDFGLAKLLDATGHRAPATQGSVRLGTPAYMAPELLAGESSDPRIDLFSLGVVLFEASSGRRPWPEPTASNPWVEPSSSARPRIGALAPELPPTLAELVERCLALDPAARPASATRILDALAASSAPRRGAPARPSGFTPDEPRSLELRSPASASLPPAGRSASQEADPRPPPSTLRWALGVLTALLFAAAVGWALRPR